MGMGNSSALIAGTLRDENAGCFTFLSSWCLVIVVWLFLTMPRVYLRFVIVVFPDHTRLLFLSAICDFGTS